MAKLEFSEIKHCSSRQAFLVSQTWNVKGGQFLWRRLLDEWIHEKESWALKGLFYVY